MKTTIDLPEDLLERSKMAAAKRRTSLKKLVIEGLEKVVAAEDDRPSPTGALARLKQGYNLGKKPLSRDQVHAR